MIKRDALFDQLWSQLEDQAASRDTVVDRALPVGLESHLSMAAALKSYGLASPALNLDRAWQSLRPRLDEVSPARRPAQPIRLRASRARWSLRLAAAAAAALVAIAAVSRQALPGSTLYPVRLTMERVALAFVPNSGSLHLRIAEARLNDLIETLQDGPAAAAPGVARALVSSRGAARVEGADVSHLDAAIASQIPPALASVTAGIAHQIRVILGAVLPPDPAAPPPPVAGRPGTPGVPESEPEAPRHGGAPGEHGDGGSGGSDRSQEGDRGPGSDGSGSGGSGDGSGEGSSPQSPGTGEGSGSEGPGSDGGGGGGGGSHSDGSEGPSGD